MAWFFWSVAGFVVLFLVCFIAGAIKVAGEADRASEMERLEDNPDLAERLNLMFGREPIEDERKKPSSRLGDGRTNQTFLESERGL